MAVPIEIWAKTNTISLPGISPVSIWGFAASAGGPAQLPGPLIEVYENDTLELTLHNNLNFPASISFPGQEFTPQPAKDPNGKFISFNSQASAGGSNLYTITPNRPGIFLYESGTSPETQIQMGLYGIMVVRPAGYNPGNPSTWTAYGVGTNTEYDVENILVIGEVDTAQHNLLSTGNPPGPYNPDYFIINGRSYPNTVDPNNAGSQPYGSKITASAGQRVLLRLINAGFTNHNIHFQVPDVRIVAIDSWPMVSVSNDGTYLKNTITIGSGESYDVLFTAPAPGKYMIYDRNLNCAVNGNDFPGGIMTMIEIV